MKILILTAAAWLSYRFKKIDLSGGVAGVLISWCLWTYEWVVFLLFGLFFLLGSVVTRWQFQTKKHLGVAQENQGKRTWINATANGAAAALCCGLGFLTGEHRIFSIAAAASIAAAFSDTISSELGNLYGKRYLNILTFRTAQRGTDGAISLEGTALGAAASLSFAGIFALLLPDFGGFWAIALCGFFGNLTDSALGATLQQRGYLSNHGVNFWNTVTAAVLAVLILVLG